MVFRFLICNQVPNHTTFARFRKRHSAAFTTVFAQVLDHCQLAGLGKAGTIALDGTKRKSNAAMDQNRTLKKITEELARDAEAKDLAEDFRYGKGKQKNELPKGVRRREDRRKRLLEAKRLIEEKQSQKARANAARTAAAGAGCRD